MKLRLGTRGSDLALWQAHFVQSVLAAEAEVELVIISTEGDEVLDRPLQEVEGVGFFTSRLEQALVDGEIDLAVHSHKDMALKSPEGLVIAAIPERGPVAERLLVHPDAHDPKAPLLPLKRRAKLGTSAPRRAGLLATLRDDVEVVSLRGNVPSRVERVREKRLDAVLLADAGLTRLELDLGGLVSTTLCTSLMVPSPAQGALAVQVREDDTATYELVHRLLHHEATAACVDAERQVLAWAGGGCHLPLGTLVTPNTTGGFRADLFLGADLPERGRAPRWAEASGETPEQAVEAAWARGGQAEPTRTGPLAPLRVVLVGSATGGTTLGERLEQLGAHVAHEKLLSFEGLKAPELPALLARLKPVDVVAVTSGEAARRLKGQRVPPGVTVAAVGPATAKALVAEGIKPGLVGGGGARDLAKRIEVGEGGKVLFPCSEKPRPELMSALRARGIEVQPVALYRTVADASSPLVDDVDARIYMSPSAVGASMADGRETTDVKRISLGGSTSDALQDEDLEHHKPKGSGPEAVVHLLLQLASDGALPRVENPERTS